MESREITKDLLNAIEDLLAFHKEAILNNGGTPHVKKIERLLQSLSLPPSKEVVSDEEINEMVSTYNLYREEITPFRHGAMAFRDTFCKKISDNTNIILDNKHETNYNVGSNVTDKSDADGGL